MPRAAQDFLRLSDVEIRWYARAPDEISGDNIAVFGGCAIEEAHAHSYKVERGGDGTYHHLTGSVPTVIAQTPRLARNAVREGRFDEAREHMGKLLHYAVDATTIWHLTRELTPAQHKAGEGEIGKAIAKYLPEGIKLLDLPQPKSLYRSAIAVCEETVSLQLDRARAVQDAGPITKDGDLVKEMVARCAGFALACELYVWRFVEKA